MVYSTGLIVLAVSVDRRLTGPASFYGLTALFLVFTSWPSSYVFCIGSVAACLFLAYASRRRTGLGVTLRHRHYSIMLLKYLHQTTRSEMGQEQYTPYGPAADMLT